jgi:DNA polymerase-3 subunit alpha
MRKFARTYNAPDLHAHSTFSLLDGFGTPKAVVERAIALGWGAACLTEHGWIGSAPSFYKACVENKIKPILGCEFYIIPDDLLGVKGKETRSASFHLTVLALSKEGYHNLVHWSTESMQPDNFYYRPRISLSKMIETAPYPLHHNVVLSGCLGAELPQMLANGDGLEAGTAYVQAMKSAWPNFYIEVQNHEYSQFLGRGFQAYEEMVEREANVREGLLSLAQLTDTKIVLTNDSHFQESSQRKAHMAMLASKLKRWSKDDTHHGQSDEHELASYIRDYAYWRNYLQNMEKIEDVTPGLEGACQNVLDIVDESRVVLDPLDNFSFSIPFSGYDDPVSEIRNRAAARLKIAKREHGREAVDRFEHELKAMGDFAHYLLMMSDLIIHAREQGILTNTRGSAANSLVCYCLYIHNYDPIHYKLTFERFVNPERPKLPDVDIDIQYDRYEDFMSYVKEYVQEREGEDSLVLLCNYGTLANRSTFRMVADSLGIPQEQQNEIADLLPQMIDSGLVDEEEDVYSALKETYPEIYELASGVFDNLKSVGQHACGWLFGTSDRPLADWIPRYYIASSGQLVSQYDYKNALLFGLNKGDFLRLKMLSVVANTLKALGKNPLDLEQIPLDDPATFEMIRAGKTEGIFTLQGKTNRQGVMEVEPTDEHGVIASVAIYRPSLTRPGYHRVYNNRRTGREEVTYPHKVAEDVLGESFGLPIFQEQILELGYAVGFTHGEAQELLDAIKLAKGVGRGAAEAFDKIHPVFVARATEHGLTEEEAENVWEFVGSFQGYGFNRGHATSYGTLATRAAYLKCHHPQEYFVSLLDIYPEKHKYIAAAKDEGFKLLTPSVNQSKAGFSKGVDEESIRVGLARIHGLGPVALREILAGQPFSSVDDLKERTNSRAVKSNTISNLAAVGAFEEFGIAGSDDDTELLRMLGFLVNKPRAMKNIKPRFCNARNNGSWRHLGLHRGVEIGDMRTSVSKLFWVPELEEKELLKLKASAWARVKTWLLTVVDENGLPFEVMANEDKTGEVDYLKFISKRCRGAVICMDGSIRKPFDSNGPMSFRFFNVTGAFNGEAQVWNVDDEKVTKYFNILNRRKQNARKAVAA